MATLNAASGGAGPASARAGVDLEMGALLAMAAIEDLGPATVCALVDRCGGALEALHALTAGATEPGELNRRQRARARAALGGRRAQRVAAETASKAERRLKPDDRLVGYGRPGYPERLTRLHFPPPVLWARGPLSVDAPRAVAVVGTRRATAPARRLARDMAAELAAAGVRVVSGLASGIDGQAHRGALEAGGETTAVLGSGLDFRYPASNHDIYARLRHGGLILTEFAPHVRPESHHFPRRNRIVAALCDAVVVVQAGERSGALLTAGEALEIGVEVLVCPGDPRHAASVGCHGLLRDGAGLVTGASHVLEELGWQAPGIPAARRREWSDAERMLIDRLDREPAALDELAVLAGGIRPAATLLARLELAGEVVGLPGGRYERALGATR